MTHASAYVVEIDGHTAGLAVAEGNGFLFFASDRRAYALDGSRFGSLASVNTAVGRLLAKGRTRHADTARLPDRRADLERAAA